MNFLSIQSLKWLQTFYPFFGQFSNYRVASYLSFLTNQKGDKLTYNKNLSKNAVYKDPKNNNHKLSLEQYALGINQYYTMSRSFLIGLYQNQILNIEDSNLLLKNCIDLQLEKKKDISQFMLGNQINYDIKNWINNLRKGNQNNFEIQFLVKKKIPQQKQKKMFLLVEDKITNLQDLQNKILQKYQFLMVPNVGKILCLDLNEQNSIKLKQKISKVEKLFKQYNIKIKNTQIQKRFQQLKMEIKLQKQNEQIFIKGYKIYKLLEYIYKNIKGNTLLHQLPEYYKFYNKTLHLQNSELKLNMYAPLEVFLFVQRINLDNFSSNQQFQFQEFKKNFIPRFQKDPYVKQKSTGFIVSRHLSLYNKKKYQHLIQMQQKGIIIQNTDWS